MNGVNGYLLTGGGGIGLLPHIDVLVVKQSVIWSALHMVPSLTWGSHMRSMADENPDYLTDGHLWFLARRPTVLDTVGLSASPPFCNLSVVCRLPTLQELAHGITHVQASCDLI